MMQKQWRALVQFGFRLLYNELAWTYDAVSWVVSLGQWRRWQQASLPHVSGERVLELGHGPGHMLRALAERGQQPVGLDLSPAMGRQARRRLAARGLAIPLVRGRVQALPFAAGAFDTVLATFPTEYIVDPATLTAVKRVLKRNGRFVIVPGAQLTGSNPLSKGLEWLYAITGQRQRRRSGSKEITEETAIWQRFQPAFAAAGFELAAHRQTFTRSVVLVLVATAVSPDRKTKHDKSR